MFFIVECIKVFCVALFYRVCQLMVYKRPASVHDGWRTPEIASTKTYTW